MRSYEPHFLLQVCTDSRIDRMTADELRKAINSLKQYVRWSERQRTEATYHYMARMTIPKMKNALKARVSV